MGLFRSDFHCFEVNGDTLLALASGEIFVLDGLAKVVLDEVLCSAGLEGKSELTGCGADCGMANLKVCATGGDTDCATGGAGTIGDGGNTAYTSGEIAEARGELERILCRRIKDHSGDTPPRQLRALCLNVTHRCNLACEYCFAGKVVDKCAPSMDSAIVRQSIDFLIRESGDVPRLQVDFFGGEPLLVFPLVKEGIIYGEQRAEEAGKRIGFTLTTNAVLLNDEVIDFVKEHNVSLILSLDGDRDANDAHRKTHSGGGSFDVVFKNISKVKEKLNKNQYYVRGTFTSKTPEIHSALEFYDKQGFYNVSLEPVTSEDGTGYALREQDMPTLLDSYNKAAQWMLDRDMQFFHFNLEMDNPLCLTRRITGCGAGVEYMAVDPGGNLYPCHQFIEMQGYSIGDVFNGISNEKLIDTFRQSTIYQKEGCSDCWARFYCGGGCHFRHFSENGDIDKPSSLSCRLFTKRLETALWYNVKKREKAGK